MNTGLVQSNKTTRWPLIATLSLAAIAILYFIWANALQYLTADPVKFGADFWPRRFGLWPHLAGGGIAITAGIAQLWLGFTGRTGALHRKIGRLYLSGVLVGCLGGYYLSFTAVYPPGLAYRAGLFFFAFAWTVTTAVALLAIRRGKIDVHREWMVRSYVVTFGFVTFRLFDPILGAVGMGPEDERQRMLAWFCWSVPLLLTVAVQELLRLPRGASQSP
jgi:uncharacterized membrane protein YozB (DUF420 family)